MDVFISSTCYDLLDLRAELEAFFREAGVSVRMSDRPSSEFEVLPDRNSIETCRANVRACEQFVIVLSQRYGPSLKEAGYEDVSATHLEYREAVKAGKRVWMYVRDRLDGDFNLWKRNQQQKDLNFAWCKEARDHGLFQLLTEHTKLAANEPRSNWLTLFQDSVDLKQQLARDFKATFAHATADALFKSGRVPFLDASWRMHSHDNREIKLELTVRNLGNVAALSPILGFERNAFVIELRSLAPSESASCMVPWGNFWGTNLELLPQLAYATVEGHKFIDCGKVTVKYPLNKSDGISVGYELSSRKYDGFSETVLPKAG